MLSEICHDRFNGFQSVWSMCESQWIMKACLISVTGDSDGSSWAVSHVWPELNAVMHTDALVQQTPSLFICFTWPVPCACANHLWLFLQNLQRQMNSDAHSSSFPLEKNRLRLIWKVAEIKLPTQLRVNMILKHLTTWTSAKHTVVAAERSPRNLTRNSTTDASGLDYNTVESIKLYRGQTTLMINQSDMQKMINK